MKLRYMDPALPPQERAEDLLSRMNVQQKIDQLGCVFTMDGVIPDMDEAAPRGIGHIGMLGGRSSKEDNIRFTHEVQDEVMSRTPHGIPALIHSEALSGLMARDASVFPVAIGLSCTWDPDAVREMGDLIRRQMTAVGFRQALSPVLDISRDPRWGRIGESYGEDPCLGSAMAVAFVGGIQGSDLKEGVAATAKHFAAYGAGEAGMNMAQANVSERSFQEVYARPFQAAITEAGLQAVMNSYGSVNNEPVCASKGIQTDLLRGEMGFEGIVVTDYRAIDRLVSPFRAAADYPQAGALALEAGVDVEYPKPLGFAQGLGRMIQRGEVPMAALDQAVMRNLVTKFKLGLFENPYGLEESLAAYSRETTEEANRKLARESVVLLKNDNGLLPLQKQAGNIAVIGPHAHSIRSIFGCYTYPAMYEMRLRHYTGEAGGDGADAADDLVDGLSFSEPGVVQPEDPRLDGMLRAIYPHSRSLLEAIRELAPDAQVAAATGCAVSDRDAEGFGAALQLAREADVVVLTLGGKNGWGPTCTIGEGIDSMNVGLPGVQLELAREIAALGKPTVVVHMDGRPLCEPFVAEQFPAILEAWQPGEFGGQAIAEILFGEYNPGGKLSVTVPRGAGQLPVYYALQPNCGYEGAGQVGMVVNPNGYADESALPLYYFGHGLSYTTFSYEQLQVVKDELQPDERLEVALRVRNTGAVVGDEVVQLYVSDRLSSMVRPVKELVGFRRVHLQPGEACTVTFTLPLSQLAFLDGDMRWKVEAGEFELQAGASAADIRLRSSFVVRKDAFVNGQTRGFFAQTRVDR